MEEKLKDEAKALIDSGKYEEAKKKIDEIIAARPVKTAGDNNDLEPLPGTGSNGELPVK